MSGATAGRVAVVALALAVALGSAWLLRGPVPATAVDPIDLSDHDPPARREEGDEPAAAEPDDDEDPAGSRNRATRDGTHTAGNGPTTAGDNGSGGANQLDATDDGGAAAAGADTNVAPATDDAAAPAPAPAPADADTVDNTADGDDSAESGGATT